VVFNLQVHNWSFGQMPTVDAMKSRTGHKRALVAGAVMGLLFSFLSPPAFSGEVSKPQRIVSLNLCTDQIVQDLVSGERIAGLSYLSADPTMSAKAEESSQYRLLRGRAEEVLELNPDLILVGNYTTPAVVNLLKRLGRRVVAVEQPTTFDGIRKLVMTVALAVGEEQRGWQLIADFDLRLSTAAAGSNRSPAPRVVALEVNNFTQGEGTLLDAIISASGLSNMASQRVPGGIGRVSLEQLVQAPPDLLVLAHGPATFRTVLADNLRHPVVRALRQGRPKVTLPMSSYLCGTPAVVNAVEMLSDARRSLPRQRVGQKSRSK
jgi:iron complex transport system substrate-binding protein